MVARNKLISGKLVCPRCGCGLDLVKDSRPEYLHGFQTIQRRRECSGCGRRSVTMELTRADMNAFARALELERRNKIEALQSQIAALGGTP
jgi:transcriptional regulator NrdR family protein